MQTAQINRGLHIKSSLCNAQRAFFEHYYNVKEFSANIVLIVSYLLIVQSIICYKNQKHFNQFTMSLLFCVILFYMIFLVSAAASVGTEQMSTGHLVVFASLRSVQSGHPPDVLHPCICPYQGS